MPNIFEEMTNLYSLSKTLRFELKPVGETLEHMKANGIIERDEQISKDYQVVKPIFDDLHDRFIKESLTQANINREDFLVFYREYKKKVQDKNTFSESDRKKLEEEFRNMLTDLRKQVGKLFGITAEQRKKNPERINEKGAPFLADVSYKILTENNILHVLEKENKDDKDKVEAIARFHRFFTYFGGFNQNRENYYSVEDKSTAVSYRIVNENLLTFCQNIFWLETLKSKYDTNFSELQIRPEEMKIFDIHFYNQCLHQEGITAYNEIIGRKSDDEKQKGLNQRINEHNQHYKTKIPKLKQLYKQIGSQIAKTIPFTLIETDEGLKETLSHFMISSEQKNKEITELMNNVFNDRMNDLNKIWFSKASLNLISNMYFANRYALQERGIALGIFKEKKKNEEEIKMPNYISLAELKHILEGIVYTDQSDIEDDKKTYLFKRHLEDKRNGEKNNWVFFLKVLKQNLERIMHADEEMEDEKGKKFKYIGYYPALERLKKCHDTLDKTNIMHKNAIKDFADRSLDILRFLKLFAVQQDKIEGDIDQDFYADYDGIIKDYAATKRYDAIRNYMTQKPYSDSKMKLNFDSSTLLAGRDKNKETQNLSVILKDNHKYYLAIMRKSNNKFFDKNDKLYAIEEGTDILYKMEYKLLPGPNKMLPKCLMPGKDKKKYGATDEILDIYTKGEFKKGDDFNKQSLGKLIDFYKEGLKRYEDWQVFDFSFKNTQEYEDISQFYSDVEKQGYKISWTGVQKEILLNAADKGDMYLFEISSKDFQKKNLSSNNDLQTIYRQNIFLSQSNVKLNGEAEVFFRKPSIKEKDQKTIITKENKHEIIAHTPDNKEYKPLENQRYTQEKILFHVPITVGFGNKSGSKFNQKLNLKIKENFHDIKVIGIDRGEKHLAFYSVIDTSGKIVEQGTLNTVEGINYEEKLSEKAKTRLEARQNWETIGNIKNLKEGYISQVVRKIADLIIEHKAMVVFEDLNGGFKRGRQKIEQSVYQKLELALAKKLNFLVNKKDLVTKEPIVLGKPGSATHAYQLTPPVSNFGDIKGKQRGIMFYTRANYTSITDPVTGFRKNLYLKKGKIEDMRKQILAFDAIGYQNGAYFFSYDPRKFAEGRGSKSWTVRSSVDRYRGTKNNYGKWEIKYIAVTQELKKLFERHHIVSDMDILAQIRKNENLSSEFYSSLIWYIDLILQIRNNGDTTKEGELVSDFIHSPVKDKDGNFFDSREYKKLCPQETENHGPLPTSGDANGAYNIARKGLMMLERIRENAEKPNLFVSDDEWDLWVDYR